MWLQFGMTALKGVTGYIQSAREASYKQKIKEYNNQMVRLADANNQNAITTNQNLAVERSTRTAFAIERSHYATTGKAEVAAAASGTAGRSVNQTMFQIDRSAAEAEASRKSDLDAQLAGFSQQRLNSNMQARQATDISFIPQPNPAATMLGLTGDLIKVYNRHQSTLQGAGLP